MYVAQELKMSILLDISNLLVDLISRIRILFSFLRCTVLTGKIGAFALLSEGSDVLMVYSGTSKLMVYSCTSSFHLSFPFQDIDLLPEFSLILCTS